MACLLIISLWDFVVKSGYNPQIDQHGILVEAGLNNAGIAAEKEPVEVSGQEGMEESDHHGRGERTACTGM